jgi:hypothetical protein
LVDRSTINIGAAADWAPKEAVANNAKSNDVRITIIVIPSLSSSERLCPPFTGASQKRALDACGTVAR